MCLVCVCVLLSLKIKVFKKENVYNYSLNYYSMCVLTLCLLFIFSCVILYFPSVFSPTCFIRQLLGTILPLTRGSRVSRKKESLKIKKFVSVCVSKKQKIYHYRFSLHLLNGFSSYDFECFTFLFAFFSLVFVCL